MYRYYRFYGPSTGSCIVGEVSLRGYEAIDNNSPSIVCNAQISINGGTAVQLTGDITYQNTLTPLLTSISPRFGTVTGGETVTFNGNNFSNNPSDYTVLIDGRPCSVTSATSTSFQCTTASRPGLYPDPTLSITIAGQGSVAT